MSQLMVEQELEFFQIPSPFKQPRPGETLHEKLRAVKERFTREERAKFEEKYVRVKYITQKLIRCRYPFGIIFWAK